MSSSWNSLGLHSWLSDQCKELGILKPSEIQEQCIPQILKGKDCIGCSKTGSGKTAAFALPILQKLSEDPYGIFALILTPTRELAFQIADQFRVFGKSINLKDTIVVGGMDMVQQAGDLNKKPHIVIATPGRLAALMSVDADFTFKNIQFLVLDEADRLLESSFEDDLKFIFSNISKSRQTLLFSATLTDTMEQLRLVTKKDHFCYEVKSQVATVQELDQRFLLIPSQVKDCYLIHLLQTFIENKSVIIFTHTCRSCHVLSFLLRKLGIKCAALHSLLSQRERLASLARFKTEVVKILIATDVASRGLDIPLVELVVNYNVPGSSKDYIHRVGRTARAGRGGMSLTLMTQYDIERLTTIEDDINTKMTEFETNETDALKLLKIVSVTRREVEIRLNDSGFGERRLNNRKKHGLPPNKKFLKHKKMREERKKKQENETES